jgi:hypothetical protein
MCRALKNKSDLENFLLKTLIFHFFVTLDAKLITAYFFFFVSTTGLMSSLLGAIDYHEFDDL